MRRNASRAKRVKILTFFRGKSAPRPQQRAAPAGPIITQRAPPRPPAAPAPRQGHQQAQQPENEYLGISQRLIEETLPGLLATD